ncbi:flavin monoamine oxidase family protein [Sphingomonas sp.]|uniref:flavin monoamine oxidase family protein n=1 Tax=Sphingomonas sp. TaxID=28214 RepID=UPI003B3A1F76
MSTARAAAMPALPPTLGNGKHVIVLGAGISGLVAAYELEQAGFLVTLLEARERVGGRAWTVRDGDKIEMIGEETQTARFTDGAYFNAGPARIPSFHTGLLGYADKFGVPLEVEVNSSRSAYIVGDDGAKLRQRTAVNDMRGHIAELLSKAVSQGALDQRLTPGDKEKLLPFLRFYGDLDDTGAFTGTARSGFQTMPGAGPAFATHHPARPLGELLANQQLPMTLFDDAFYMQATMVEPVGGMDRIHAGFDRNLRRPAIRGAEVTRIRDTAKGVEVVYRDKASHATNVVSGDYLICTIPFPVLSSIDTNFSKPVAQAIAGVVYDHSNKIAFDAPRFWETEDQIYGGITFVGGPTSLIWYPSAAIHSARGMLLACYASGPVAADFQKRPIAEQIEYARAVVEKVHPGHGKDLSNGIAVNWHKIPYSLGPWPAWNPGQAGRQEGNIDTPAFRLLQKPDGRVYFASAALSQTPGWQEGGIASAHYQVKALAGRVTAEALAEPSWERRAA